MPKICLPQIHEHTHTQILHKRSHTVISQQLPNSWSRVCTLPLRGITNRCRKCRQTKSSNQDPSDSAVMINRSTSGQNLRNDEIGELLNRRKATSQVTEHTPGFEHSFIVKFCVDWIITGGRKSILLSLVNDFSNTTRRKVDMSHPKTQNV